MLYKYVLSIHIITDTQYYCLFAQSADVMYYVYYNAYTPPYRKILSLPISTIIYVKFVFKTSKKYYIKKKKQFIRLY